MSGPRVPLIEERTQERALEQLRSLFETYVADVPSEELLHGVSGAAAHVFARYCELLADRLNETPDRTLAIFLGLLGAQSLPPQPAEAPITFVSVPGGADRAVVPAGTQVAAPAEGSRPQVLFETTAELFPTSAILDSLFVKNPDKETYSDLSAVLSATVETPIRATTPIEHAWYLRHDTYFAYPGLKDLRVKIALAQAENLKPLDYEWQICGPAGWVSLQPISDTTHGLSQSGEVAFPTDAPTPICTVNGVAGRWIRCRLVPGQDLRTRTLPGIASVKVEMSAEGKGLKLLYAFLNGAELDTTKDFYPFGEYPRFGDTLYLSGPDPGQVPGAIIEIDIKLRNPSDAPAGSGLPPVRPQAVRIAWEYWDGEQWVLLNAADQRHVRLVTAFHDSTEAFSKSGRIRLRFPKSPQPAELFGRVSVWIRARIVAGDYGAEGRLEKDAAGNLVVTPSTLAPPVIESVALSYSASGEASPHLLTENDFTFFRPAATQTFEPFVPVAIEEPAAYLGFLATAESLSTGRPVNTYWDFGSPPAPDRHSKAVLSPKPIPIVWSYSLSARTWMSLRVLDETGGLQHSGVIQFRPPAGLSPSLQFGRMRHWLRVTRRRNETLVPTLRRGALNTVVATQSVTYGPEILGSSSGAPGQSFRATRVPVLSGEKLEVREAVLPSAAERAAIEAEGGSIIPEPVPGRSGTHYWVSWQARPDFYGSGVRDRHYVIDRLTGEIRFGDGIHGMIPPRLTGNIRLSRYRTGGGSSGNVPAGAITQIKTSRPYIESVTNPLPATGGADAEKPDAFRRRIARELRHRGRAVTCEDYEDLAVLATPEVGRARCVAAADLSVDRDAARLRPGHVSLILAPISAEARPQPTVGLFDQVRRYLDYRRYPDTELVLLGPEYVPVDVSLTAVAAPGAAGNVEALIRRTLEAFLHPTTGGVEGTGWEFGQRPQRSDLYRVIEALSEVDYVRKLEIGLGDHLGSERLSRALICAGAIDIEVEA